MGRRLNYGVRFSDHGVADRRISNREVFTFVNGSSMGALVKGRRAMLWAIAERQPDKAYRHARTIWRHAMHVLVAKERT